MEIFFRIEERGMRGMRGREGEFESLE